MAQINELESAIISRVLFFILFTLLNVKGFKSDYVALLGFANILFIYNIAMLLQ
ncbi:hypothetical protein ADIWIN_0665 [Winogradskyella psychrotolerans RS-3]|uniref:Uncharacterized protein n=1 Tax=Winogradskyella psychrotolerans RS-3 TaxID=641526 RepID=S7XEA1_9FLAO|nr:hypothetical protein ADIWIN_0665 [Winogradskyella psychrotolerans RS-3]